MTPMRTVHTITCSWNKESWGHARLFLFDGERTTNGKPDVSLLVTSGFPQVASFPKPVDGPIQLTLESRVASCPHHALAASREEADEHESRESNQILPAFRWGAARRALCRIPRSGGNASNKSDVITTYAR
jgi:hypothetical protein